MIAFNAHFDGKVIVPSVDLPVNRAFVVHVETSGSAELEPDGEPVSGLRWLAENAVDDELPSDLAAQHGHYLWRECAGRFPLSEGSRLGHPGR